MKKIIRLTEHDLFKIVKRVINEQTPSPELNKIVGKAKELYKEGFFQMDFSNWTSIDQVEAKNIPYKGKNYNIKFASLSGSYGGGFIRKEVTPGKTTPPITIPGESFTFEAENQFGDNLITPSEIIIAEIRKAALKLINTMIDVYEKNNGNKNSILYFLGDGFTAQGHADGNPPKFVNDTIIKDHAKNGFNSVFNGITDMYQRNSWLARNRAKTSYSEFINTVAKLAPSVNSIFKDKVLMDGIMNILKLTDDGGKSTLSIVNHLNQDGSRNSAEIGPFYRRMEFIPKLNTEGTKTPEEIKPPKIINKPVLYNYTGYLKLPVFRGDTTDNPTTVDGVQLYGKEYTATGNETWWGIAEEDISKYSKIVPTIGANGLNGKTKTSAQITKKDGIMIDNIDFGKIFQMSGDYNRPYATSGRLCVDLTQIPLEYEGKKYRKLSWFGVSFRLF